MAQIDRAIFTLLRMILTAMVLVMTLVILGQIIARYVLEVPFVWSEELSLLLMTWITFLGSALLLERNEHLAIDLLVEAFPGHFAHAARILGAVLVLVFSLCLIWGAWRLMAQTWTSITPGMKISVAWQYGGAFVGGILLIWVSLRQFWAALLNRPAGHGDTL